MTFPSTASFYPIVDILGVSLKMSESKGLFGSFEVQVTEDMILSFKSVFSFIDLYSSFRGIIFHIGEDLYISLLYTSKTGSLFLCVINGSNGVFGTAVLEALEKDKGDGVATIPIKVVSRYIGLGLVKMWELKRKGKTWNDIHPGEFGKCFS